MIVYSIVHPVSTLAHPTYPQGWRWAVMVTRGPYPGARDAAEVEATANAGWQPDRAEATSVADQNCATAVQALRKLGMPVEYRAPLVLDHDPIPPGQEQLQVL